MCRCWGAHHRLDGHQKGQYVERHVGVVEYRKLDVVVLPASGKPILLRGGATIVTRQGREMMHCQQDVSSSRAKIRKKNSDIVWSTE